MEFGEIEHFAVRGVNNMRCEQCGQNFAAGLPQCPRCGAAIHYGGKTEFYGKAVSSKLTIKDLFSEAFKKHSAGAGSKMFIAGTPLSTPSPDQMLQEWDKPWLFTRVLAIGLLFCLLNYFMYVQMGHPMGVYLLFTLGAIVIPLGILLFYWEVNIPRDIPIYKVLLIFFIGGMLSLVFAMFLATYVGDAPAYLLAPLVEEPAKVIALAIFVYLLDSKYIFGGLLIGAAVGAGFSAFENIYYVMNYGSFSLLITRSLLTVGGHVTWAAIEGGALAMVKGRGKLQLKHFANTRFLIYLAVAMILHCIWDSDISLVSLPLVSDLKYLLLCVAAVYFSFTLIKKAIAQVLATVDSAKFQQHRRHAQSTNGGDSAAATLAIVTLTAVSGPLTGAVFPFYQSVTIGRDPAVCNVIFPPETAGVSRRHCVLECRADGVYLMDLGSSAGTFLQSGQRLPNNQWVRIAGDFYLGAPSIMFSVSNQRANV